jgi:hypothetical protein
MSTSILLVPLDSLGSQFQQLLEVLMQIDTICAFWGKFVLQIQFLHLYWFYAPAHAWIPYNKF